VRSIIADAPVRIETPQGQVVAEQVVVGINAWSDRLPGMKNRIVSRASHIVLTEPAPDQLAEIGWTGGEGIDDLRSTVDYVRTTRDGRIAFGQGTGDAARANARRLSRDPAWTERITRRLRDWFPEFRDVPIAASWGGPVDVSPFHLPFFAQLGAGNVHSAAGYSGSGVGASMLCGRILASRVLGRADEFTDLPLSHYRPKAFPPGPIFATGAKLVLPAVVRLEDAWEQGEQPGVWSRAWARLPRRLGYNLGP
jgi:glycine/D-amino acid oxidase-like deaminating enzyme